MLEIDVGSCLPGWVWFQNRLTSVVYLMSRRSKRRLRARLLSLSHSQVVVLDIYLHGDCVDTSNWQSGYEVIRVHM